MALTRREFVTTRKGKSFYTIKPNPTMKYLANAYSTDFILTNCAAPRDYAEKSKMLKYAFLAT